MTSLTYTYGTKRTMKPVSKMVGLLLLATLGATLGGLVMAGGHLGRAFASASFQSGTSWHAVGGAIWHGLTISTFDPTYWAFIAFLTLLQFLWPARREDARIGAEMAIDAVWFVMGNAFQLTAVAVTLGAATVAYNELVGAWSLNLERWLGHWGLAVVAFILTDALAWSSHWCHHKVPTLWRFHAVHHSQQRLNALADNRTHVGENIFAALIVFIPSEILGLNAGAAATLAFIGIYYSAMLHSNVRTNLGPLRYVFMGPQPHRVHHSVESQYYEHNFGTVFPWWDFLAGTYYRGVNEYPPTGITDANFPLRRRGDFNPLTWVLIFMQQLAYPFRSIVSFWMMKPGRHAVTSPNALFSSRA